VYIVHFLYFFQNILTLFELFFFFKIKFLYTLDDLINYRREDKNGNTTAYNVLEDVNLTYSEVKNHTIEVETILLF